MRSRPSSRSKPCFWSAQAPLEPRTQAMFALAHEVGHCKLRDAFLNRPDGSAADASVFPWLAQEAERRIPAQGRHPALTGA